MFKNVVVFPCRNEYHARDIGAELGKIGYLCSWSLPVGAYDEEDDVYILTRKEGEWEIHNHDCKPVITARTEEEFYALAAMRTDGDYGVGELLQVNNAILLDNGSIIKITAKHGEGGETWYFYQSLTSTWKSEFVQSSSMNIDLTRRLTIEEIQEFFNKKSNMKQTFEVDKEFILQAYNVACNDWKNKLKAKFPDVWPKDITEQVKTWGDVLNLSRRHFKLPIENPSYKGEVAINAFAKIQLIAEVLNEGWEPDWDNKSEYKYYPWFQKTVSGWVLLLVGYCGGYAFLGSGCFFKTEELAKYAATQFVDIYKEYLPK